MNSLSIILAVLASLSVVAVLGLGLFAMAKGGEFNKKHCNRLMRARIMLQGLALVFLALAYWSSQG